MRTPPSPANPRHAALHSSPRSSHPYPQRRARSRAVRHSRPDADRAEYQCAVSDSLAVQYRDVCGSQRKPQCRDLRRALGRRLFWKLGREAQHRTLRPEFHRRQSVQWRIGSRLQPLRMPTRIFERLHRWLRYQCEFVERRCRPHCRAVSSGSRFAAGAARFLAVCVRGRRTLCGERRHLAGARYIARDLELRRWCAARSHCTCWPDG